MQLDDKPLTPREIRFVRRWPEGLNAALLSPGQRRTRIGPQPLLPSHKFHADAVIVDDEISVLIAPDCAGFNLLHVLRHDAHISGSIAALVAEAIEFETVVEPDQRDDILLKADVGTTSAASSSAATMSTTAAMRTATTTMSATGTMAPTAAGTLVATTLVMPTGLVLWSFATALVLWTFANIVLPL